MSVKSGWAMFVGLCLCFACVAPSNKALDEAQRRTILNLERERIIEREAYTARIRELKGKLGELDKRYAEWEGRQTRLAEQRIEDRLEWISRSLLHELSFSESRPMPAAYAAYNESWRKHSAMVKPIVQISGEETLGAGVTIFIRPLGNLGTEVFILTAYHVVRNIQSEGGNPDALKVLVYTYLDPDRPACEVKGVLVAHDEAHDLAALRVVLGPGEIVPPAVRIASVGQAIAVPLFTPVYAVGCPLGNDPIATLGEIGSKRSVVGNYAYWMVTAPAYFGNSGGGVFLADTCELIGLYSKIYTHGRGRPTVIEHLGLMTPITSIAEFLASNGLGFILGMPEVAQSQPAPASQPKPIESTFGAPF